MYQSFPSRCNPYKGRLFITKWTYGSKQLASLYRVTRGSYGVGDGVVPSASQEQPKSHSGSSLTSKTNSFVKTFPFVFVTVMVNSYGPASQGRITCSGAAGS